MRGAGTRVCWLGHDIALGVAPHLVSPGLTQAESRDWDTTHVMCGSGRIPGSRMMVRSPGVRSTQPK